MRAIEHPRLKTIPRTSQDHEFELTLCNVVVRESREGFDASSNAASSLTALSGFRFTQNLGDLSSMVHDYSERRSS